MMELGADFAELMERKYEAGQKEHGGNLWEKDVREMIRAARDEVVDQWAYLDAIERGVDRMEALCDIQDAEIKMLRGELELAK